MWLEELLSKQSRHTAYMLTMRHSRGEHEAHTTQGKGVSHLGFGAACIECSSNRHPLRHVPDGWRRKGVLSNNS
ncbi:hypothetical protein KSX_80670 [Ktedonospora formicarum]|uniref:Uncharacterized protein n=1 Tax=Ktedonospora formicarum TaxID=2778364 RepID=A0A8J3I5G0_9CHLR|nr:hypothetical protein KSX_80670 [Ktedonospora formicarum]